MKTIKLPLSNIKCYSCKVKGHFITYGCGGDTCYCPYCGDDAMYNANDYKYDDMYCIKCKIVFNSGCVHAEQGCTDDVYHAMFIKDFVYKEIKYVGMPVFKDLDELKNEYQHMVCNWMCTCNDKSYDCTKACYPREISTCKSIKNIVL